MWCRCRVHSRSPARSPLQAAEGVPPQPAHPPARPAPRLSPLQAAEGDPQKQAEQMLKMKTAKIQRARWVGAGEGETLCHIPPSLSAAQLFPLQDLVDPHPHPHSHPPPSRLMLLQGS